MTGAENIVQVQIKADVASLVAGMKEAGGVTSAATEQMRDSLGRFTGAASAAGAAAKAAADDVKATGHSSHEAGSLVEGLTEHLRGMRTEMRLGNFMALQISQMGIAAKGTANEFTQMIAAIALGGPIGAAIEATKILVTTITEWGEAEKKQGEELKKIYRDVAESATEAMKKVKESFEPTTKTQAAWNAEVEKTKKQIRGWQEEIDALVAQGPGLKDFMSYLFHGGEQGRAGADTAALPVDKKIKELQAKVAEALKGLESARPAKKEAAAAESEHDQEQAEQSHNLRMMELRAQLFEGQQKLQAEFYAKAAALRAREDTTTEADDAEIALLQRKTQAEIDKLREESLKKQLDAKQKWLDTNGRLELEAAHKVEALLAGNDKARLDRSQRLTGEQKKQTEEAVKIQERAAKLIGQAFGSSFAGIITGTASVGQAFKDMAKMAVKALIDAAIKSVEAHAADAAAGAAASQAATPVIGPVLAVGAMAAMEGLVLGLIGSIPSAAGGMAQVPHDTLAFIHKDEQVWPASFASRVASMLDRADTAAAGGGAGREVHAHFHFHDILDGQSAVRVFSSPHVIRGIRESIRNGLWPSGGR